MHLPPIVHPVLKSLMKKAITILCLILSGTISFSQDKCAIVKGYAYQRTILPGMIPKAVVDEQGREVKRDPHQMITRYFFLETKPDEEIRLQHIWIKGKPYEVEGKIIEQTPVMIAKTSVGSRQRSDTLVQQTNNPVVRLSLKEPADMRANAKLSRKLKRSEVVVEYIWNGKTRYFEIGTIKILEPLALQ
jgi:hypothetical protein